MIKKIDKFIHRVIFCTVVVAVLLMLSLTVFNIVLRWFNTSVLWIDPFVRHLVFLSAFLGGALATGENNHIRIDILSKLFESIEKPNLKKWIDRMVVLVTLITTLFLTKAGYDFSLVELEFGKSVFLGIHSGALVSIIPFGMGLISFRFTLNLLLTFTEDVTREEIDG